METLKWKEKVVVKPYSLKELARLYEISEYIFKTWLKPIEPQIGSVFGQCYNIRQVELIFKNFGVPGLTMDVPMIEAMVIVHPAAVQKYAELSWDFTYRNVLHRYLLNEDEIDTIKGLLLRYYQSIPPESFSFFVKSYYDKYVIIINNVSIKRHYEKAKILSVIENAISIKTEINNKTEAEEFIPVWKNDIGIKA